MIKSVFFDFDGVIVESIDIKTKAFGKLFEREGKDISQKVVEYHLANMGVSRFDKFKYIYKNFLKRELDKATFKSLCDGFSRLVVEEVIRAPYVRGAEEFLTKYFKKYLFFVVSATPQKEIEEIIKSRGINDFFRKVYGSPASKGEAVKDVLTNYYIKPSEAVYVGDALSDYEASRANGLKFVARIKDNEKLFEGIACEKIEDLTGLDRIIKDG